MTRDGLVEQNARTKEETRISDREKDFDLRRSQDLPPKDDRDLSSETRHKRKQQSPVQETASLEQQPEDVSSQEPEKHVQEAEAVKEKEIQHGTRYQQRFTEQGASDLKPAEPELPKKESKLQFTADEVPKEPGKKLTNARRKAERTSQKLEAAQQNLPTRRKLRLGVESDVETGKAKRRLKFEKEVVSQRDHMKGAKPLRPVKKGANAAIGYAHKKIYENEHENIGIEAAHRSELVAEGGLRALNHRRKSAPYRKVSRLQKKASRASAKAAYQQVLHENPKLKSNLLTRMWQKQKIKRQYAKAAREARRAGQTAKKTAVTTEKIAGRVALFVKRHPIIFGIAALLLLLFFLISSVFTSCSSMGTGGLGIIAASSYVAEDQDINQAELSYTELETDLQIQIQNAEAQHPGYDEYRYQVGNVGHNPFELMGFLTASYHGFTYEQIEAVLREIFSEQYRLEFIPETEIRYRTETRVDPITGETTEEEVPYEWHILNIKLTANSFTDVIAGRMDNGQKELFNILMMSKGNRQYVANIFGDTDWLPYVTSYYGYRIHPISGGKDYHKAVDIGMPLGTEILAGHDGTVTQAGESGSYGLVVVIEGTMKDGRTLTTKYAHCSQLLVTPGQSVKQGDVIAKVGSTGNSTGPHLHLEVLVDGQYFNPLYFTDTGNHTAGTMTPGTPGGPEIPAYPGEPMGDGSYAALIAEAQKHLGKPYVFGASGPNSFDCSGFVCYVFNQSGVANVGRTTAQGLYNMSTPVSRENARPGDLIFFTGTYSAGTPVTPVSYTHLTLPTT